MAEKKKSIEVRFFLSDAACKKLLRIFRREKRKFEPYSFVDHYFKKKGEKGVVKVREWKYGKGRKPSAEVIFVRRDRGLKKETILPTTNFQVAFRKLAALGYHEDVKVEKREAWLIKKGGEPTYAIEYIPHLGWSGEVEIPKGNEGQIENLTKELRSYGAKGFTTKSILQILKEKMGKREEKGNDQLLTLADPLHHF